MGHAQKGRLVILEGIDGAGKTTQADRLIGALRERGEDAFRIREPGGTPFGQALREMLLNQQYFFTPEEMLLAFTLQRTQLILQVIVPEVARGRTVVADRSLVSTFVYQVQQGLAVERVLEVSRYVLELLALVRTELYILDVPPGEARRRALGDIAQVNHFDEADLEVYEARRQAYLAAPGIIGWEATVVDGTRSREEITAELLAHVLCEGSKRAGT